LQIKAHVLRVGDDIDTDVIFPARYLSVLEPKEQARYAFEPYGESFQSRLTSSPAIVAGWNFGCGSSREHAVTCLMGLGIQLVVAKSFSRIFFRNAVNNGLAVVVCDLADRIQDDELISVDVAKGKADLVGGSFQFTPLAPPLLNILQHGGLWKTPRPSAGGQ
jgi:3-isopropylmalate/(R)-2-methylmalate dehydratase small subunit